MEVGAGDPVGMLGVGRGDWRIGVCLWPPGLDEEGGGKGIAAARVAGLA